VFSQHITTMCFSFQMSATFSLLGLVFMWWVHRTNGNWNILLGVGWFVLMEMLQVIQYMYIATDIDPANPTLDQMNRSPMCQAKENQFLTFLGLVHIAFQPMFSAYLSNAFVKSESNTKVFAFVTRFQFWGGVWLISRHMITYVEPSILESYGISSDNIFNANTWNTSIEWLSGPALCTYKGFHHLAWSIPLSPVNYYVPSMSVHMMLMFLPFFVLDHGSFLKNIGNRIAGLLLFLTGPVLADWITPNRQESASIWCFFSILQVVGLVCIMIAQLLSFGKWFTKGNTKKASTKLN